jgi:glutathione S-transferase
LRRDGHGWRRKGHGSKRVGHAIMASSEAGISREARAMSTYLLVSFKTCPWVQRAAIVLREKGVAFEFRHIDRDNRPDWFLAISPHRKVPVLRIGDQISLFESNAIAEYLDETILPRLHPEDPVERARNRAWTDYLPTFAAAASAIAYAETAAAHDRAIAGLRVPFERLETALSAGGPFFNGAAYALVDAGYAPFLQRHALLDRIKPVGLIDSFPRLKAWATALIARPSTHSFPPAEFEALYGAGLKQRNVWLSQFIDAPQVAAA